MSRALHICGPDRDLQPQARITQAKHAVFLPTLRLTTSNKDEAYMWRTSIGNEAKRQASHQTCLRCLFRPFSEQPQVQVADKVQRLLVHDTARAQVHFLVVALEIDARFLPPFCSTPRGSPAVPCRPACSSPVRNRSVSFHVLPNKHHSHFKPPMVYPRGG